KSIWKSMQNQDISCTTQGYLWKAIQGTFKLGGFWDRLRPQYAHRVNCPKCGVVEMMEHILMECNIEGRKMI
ncbi:hypothetical protein IW262DRAFT_1281593, partial [Armillaria fumosa]